MLCFGLMLHPPPSVASSALVTTAADTNMSDKKEMLDPIWQPQVRARGRGYSNLKLIAVPVLATILHTAPLIYFFIFILIMEQQKSCYP